MISTHPLRRVLRTLLPARVARRRTLVVQHLGFDGIELDTLAGMLDGVAQELGLELRLNDVGGEVVLAEQGFVERIAPQVLHAFLDERPLLTVAAEQVDQDAAAGAAAARSRAHALHAELVRALQSVVPPRASGTDSVAPGPDSAFAVGFDSGFDSRDPALQTSAQVLDADSAELLNRLRCGLVDPTQAPLLASYGAGGALRFDFARGTVEVDDRADQRLRVMRELPRLTDEVVPAPDARLRDLDLVAWDMAQAARHQRLLHAPDHWWRTPLLALPGVDVRRYTQQPEQLALARQLAAGPASPSELRRRCRVGMAELRGFLQAVLFLGVAQWLPGPQD